MTQPADSWIAALWPELADASGDTFPPRPLHVLTGPGAPTLTDDPVRQETVWDFSSAYGVPIVHILNNVSTYTVLETSGDIRLVVTNLPGPLVIKFTVSTATIQVGMKITIKAKDGTFSATNSITANGNGNDVEYQAALATTFLMTPGTVGTGGSVTWMWDGTDWVSE